MLSPPPSVGAETLAHGYRSQPGAPDELCDEQGLLRRHWAPLLRHLDALGRGELGRRWAEAQQLIHENGVSYNVHGDPGGMERPWQLSPVPVLLSGEEWPQLELALLQRARLLEHLLADLHGPQRAVQGGLVPADLLHAHPGFLRACHGLQIGRWLPFYAVDLVRCSDGRFRVLSDRTQVPTGAGYALENRIICSRTLPEAFRGCNVERLAPFFRTVRDTLAGLALHNRDNPRIVMLSQGPTDPTYFEQAYLAQYLGYPLVHGGDLTVRGARVFLKTLGGLQPVDVILRRVHDDLCDPLELRVDGLAGVPGLVEAVRERTVAVANPLGSGLASTPVLLPYLPALCRYYLNEDLQLPSVDTHWCGDEKGRAFVLEHLPRLVLKPAFEVSHVEPIFAAKLDEPGLAALRARIAAKPSGFVAQEQMTIATTPALGPDGVLEPRGWVLRNYLVASGDGHVVMPGGLSRVARSTEALEVSIQRGGGSKDTWVTSRAPVAPVSLLPPAGTPVVLTRGGSDLPSRVADNLFWLGRYAERVEGLARLARVVVVRLAEQRREEDPAGELALLIRALIEEANLDLTVPDAAADVLPSWEAAVIAALYDPEEAGTLRSTLRSLNRVARECRDRISGDSWRVLVTVEADLGAALIANGESGDHSEPPADRLRSVLPVLNHLVAMMSAVSGLVGDSMTRGQAWRFLDIGRRLERAAELVTLLKRTLVHPSDREGPLLELVLEAADSGMTYRRRYLNRLVAAPVLDLLLTDETNPRSVLFQVATLSDHVAGLPRDGSHAVRGPEGRLVLEMRMKLELAAVDDLTAAEGDERPALAKLLEDLSCALPALSEALSASYLSHAQQSRQLGQASPGEVV